MAGPPSPSQLVVSPGVGWYDDVGWYERRVADADVPENIKKISGWKKAIREFMAKDPKLNDVIVLFTQKFVKMGQSKNFAYSTLMDMAWTLLMIIWEAVMEQKLPQASDLDQGYKTRFEELQQKMYKLREAYLKEIMTSRDERRKWANPTLQVAMDGVGDTEESQVLYFLPEDGLDEQTKEYFKAAMKENMKIAISRGAAAAGEEALRLAKELDVKEQQCRKLQSQIEELRTALEEAEMDSSTIKVSNVHRRSVTSVRPVRVASKSAPERADPAVDRSSELQRQLEESRAEAARVEEKLGHYRALCENVGFDVEQAWSSLHKELPSESHSPTSRKSLTPRRLQKLASFTAQGKASSQAQSPSGNWTSAGSPSESSSPERRTFSTGLEKQASAGFDTAALRELEAKLCQQKTQHESVEKEMLGQISSLEEQVQELSDQLRAEEKVPRSAQQGLDGGQPQQNSEQKLGRKRPTGLPPPDSADTKTVDRLEAKNRAKSATDKRGASKPAKIAHAHGSRQAAQQEFQEQDSLLYPATEGLAGEGSGDEGGTEADKLRGGRLIGCGLRGGGSMGSGSDGGGSAGAGLHGGGSTGSVSYAGVLAGGGSHGEGAAGGDLREGGAAGGGFRGGGSAGGGSHGAGSGGGGLRGGSTGGEAEPGGEPGGGGGRGARGDEGSTGLEKPVPAGLDSAALKELETEFHEQMTQHQLIRKRRLGPKGSHEEQVRESSDQLRAHEKAQGKGQQTEPPANDTDDQSSKPVKASHAPGRRRVGEQELQEQSSVRDPATSGLAGDGSGDGGGPDGEGLHEGSKEGESRGGGSVGGGSTADGLPGGSTGGKLHGGASLGVGSPGGASTGGEWPGGVLTGGGSRPPGGSTSEGAFTGIGVGSRGQQKPVPAGLDSAVMVTKAKLHGQKSQHEQTEKERLGQTGSREEQVQELSDQVPYDAEAQGKERQAKLLAKATVDQSSKPAKASHVHGSHRAAQQGLQEQDSLRHPPTGGLTRDGLGDESGPNREGLHEKGSAGGELPEGGSTADGLPGGSTGGEQHGGGSTGGGSRGWGVPEGPEGGGEWPGGGSTRGRLPRGGPTGGGLQATWPGGLTGDGASTGGSTGGGRAEAGSRGLQKPVSAGLESAVKVSKAKLHEQKMHEQTEKEQLGQTGSREEQIHESTDRLGAQDKAQGKEQQTELPAKGTVDQSSKPAKASHACGSRPAAEQVLQTQDSLRHLATGGLAGDGSGDEGGLYGEGLLPEGGPTVDGFPGGSTGGELHGGGSTGSGTSGRGGGLPEAGLALGGLPGGSSAGGERPRGGSTGGRLPRGGSTGGGLQATMPGSTGDGASRGIGGWTGGGRVDAGRGLEKSASSGLDSAVMVSKAKLHEQNMQHEQTEKERLVQTGGREEQEQESSDQLWVQEKVLHSADSQGKEQHAELPAKGTADQSSKPVKASHARGGRRAAQEELLEKDNLRHLAGDGSGDERGLDGEGLHGRSPGGGLPAGGSAGGGWPVGASTGSKLPGGGLTGGGLPREGSAGGGLRAMLPGGATDDGESIGMGWSTRGGRADARGLEKPASAGLDSAVKVSKAKLHEQKMQHEQTEKERLVQSGGREEHVQVSLDQLKVQEKVPHGAGQQAELPAKGTADQGSKPVNASHARPSHGAAQEELQEQDSLRHPTGGSAGDGSGDERGLDGEGLHGKSAEGGLPAQGSTGGGLPRGASTGSEWPGGGSTGGGLPRGGSTGTGLRAMSPERSTGDGASIGMGWSTGGGRADAGARGLQNLASAGLDSAVRVSRAKLHEQNTQHEQTEKSRLGQTGSHEEQERKFSEQLKAQDKARLSCQQAEPPAKDTVDQSKKPVKASHARGSRRAAQRELQEQDSFWNLTGDGSGDERGLGGEGLYGRSELLEGGSTWGGLPGGVSTGVGWPGGGSTGDGLPRRGPTGGGWRAVQPAGSIGDAALTGMGWSTGLEEPLSAGLNSVALKVSKAKLHEQNTQHEETEKELGQEQEQESFDQEQAQAKGTADQSSKPAQVSRARGSRRAAQQELQEENNLGHPAGGLARNGWGDERGLDGEGLHGRSADGLPGGSIGGELHGGGSTASGSRGWGGGLHEGNPTGGGLPARTSTLGDLLGGGSTGGGLPGMATWPGASTGNGGSIGGGRADAGARGHPFRALGKMLTAQERSPWSSSWACSDNPGQRSQGTLEGFHTHPRGFPAGAVDEPVRLGYLQGSLGSSCRAKRHNATSLSPKRREPADANQAVRGGEDRPAEYRGGRRTDSPEVGGSDGRGAGLRSPVLGVSNAGPESQLIWREGIITGRVFMAKRPVVPSTCHDIVVTGLLKSPVQQ